MNRYGSIPEITNDAHERSIDVEPCFYAEPEDADVDNNAPNPSRASYRSILLSKFGFLFIGFILGYGHANLSKLRGSTVTDDTISVLQQQRQDEQFLQYQRLDLPSKPFMDALPFEEIYPRQLWNPVQIPPTHGDHDEENEPKHKITSHHQHKKDPSKQEPQLTQITEDSSIKSSMFPYNYLDDIFSVLASPASLLPSTFTSTSTTTSNSKAHILYLASEAAFSLLYDSSNTKNYYLSEYALDYFLLSSGGFDAQINQAYCAVASVAALLNSLKYAKRFRDGNTWTFDLPVDKVYDPYPYATQMDILQGDCVESTVVGHVGSDSNIVYGIFKPPYGLNLEQTANLIKCHTSTSDWDVTFQEVDPSKLSLSKMRYDLKAALIDPDARVMINFDRKGLNQVGGGHFSPVGAYHPPTDSFLIMDVAKYKYPPVWASADTLFDAMATVDNCGKYDFPKAQDKLSGLTDFSDKDEYEKDLGTLGCQQRMRGYIVLKKKVM